VCDRLDPQPLGHSKFGKWSLARMHIPTGFVPLEDVVRMLINEFGVRPLRAG
jgi:hypothetical protein